MSDVTTDRLEVCDPRRKAARIATNAQGFVIARDPVQRSRLVDVSSWHFSDLPQCPQFGRYRGKAGVARIARFGGE
jgi:hypothetical protein